MRSNAPTTKSVLLPVLLIITSACLGFSQGTVIFGNNLANLKAPIFGVEQDFVNFGGDWANAKTGNTPTNTPAGTQVYQGTPVANYLVRFWAAPGVVTDGHLLQQGSFTATTTGSGSLAGYFPNRTVTFANLPASGVATVQVRIYDPLSVLSFGFDSSGFVSGASALFQVNIGTTATSLRSFSIGWLDGNTLAPFVPEPNIGCLLTICIGVFGLRNASVKKP